MLVRKVIVLSLVFTLAILVLLPGCRKDQIITDSSAMLDISADTILFDTIFTTIGSTTRYFKIYNNNNQKIQISDIWLGGGTNSAYRINVDGDAGVAFQDLQIEANDSAFIFVEVTVDPNGGTIPLVIEDSVMFTTNGNEQKVMLNAWGQDAYFHVNEIITSDLTWANDKPHVIYNYCAVDSNFSLTIPAGTKVHGHAGAYLLMYKSSLTVNGTVSDPVIFMQDRLEDYLLYAADSVAGQWRGLYFFEPQTSLINNAQIKNATIGIQIDTSQAGQSVSLNAVRTDNCLYAGLFCQGANVIASNCLFGWAGQYSAVFSIGGNLSVDHCTFGNDYSGSRNTALFALSNYYEDAYSYIHFRPFVQADFSNCIIYGPNDNEFVIDTLDRSVAAPPVFSFKNCLIKTDTTIINPSYFTSCWTNTDPMFINPSAWNYHVPDGSWPATSGSFPTGLFDDLDGMLRSGGAFNTLGCYEAIP